jgi:hypothetical protein
MSEYRVKDWEINGKKFKTPTIFPRIDTLEEYTIFNDLINKFGLNHTAGFITNLNKLSSVFPNIPLDAKQKLLTKNRKDNKILIIDPSLDKLLSTYGNELQNFLKFKGYFPKSKKLFSKIDKIVEYHKLKINLDEQKEDKSEKEKKTIIQTLAVLKHDIKERKITSRDIDMGFYEELFRLQDRYYSDVLAIPSIPMEFQMNKQDMDFCLKTTTDAVNLANSLYPDNKKMLILYLKQNALLRGMKIQTKEEEKIGISSEKYPFIPKEFFDMIKEKLPEREKIWGSTLHMNDFSKMKIDYIGIKITDYQIQPINEIVLVHFTSFLRELIGDKFLHIFDMDETSYALYSKGADSYSCTVSKLPFFARGHGPPSIGKWYHPIHKLFFDLEGSSINLKDMQKEEDYKIPCSCDVCETYGTFTKIEEDAKEKASNLSKEEKQVFRELWNKYRKKHWFYCKDMESEELQRDDLRLIKEVIARSKRQDLHSFF